MPQQQWIMSNSYLQIAEKTILETGRPLHPKEMLSIARDKDLVPDHLFGETQYKTLAARLSTEIRRHAKNSPFYRTAANYFFLRNLKTDEYPEYHAPKREKTLHHEYVLTISDGFLRENSAIGIFSNVSNLLSEVAQSEHLRYVIRKDAERRFDVKQLISYALVVRDQKILTYRRGMFSNASDELLGMRSIGFGGHVTDQDLNLFDTAGLGIIETARRELCEELIFDRIELDNLEGLSSFRILCGINTYESTEADKHIAVAVVYFCTKNFEAIKNEMSINDLRWLDIFGKENNLQDFEPWSQVILEAIYSGRLGINE